MTRIEDMYPFVMPDRVAVQCRDGVLRIDSTGSRTDQIRQLYDKLAEIHAQIETLIGD